MKLLNIFMISLLIVGCSDKLVIKGQGTYGQTYNTAEIHFEGAVPGLNEQQLFILSEAMRTRMFNENAFYQGRGLMVRYSVADVSTIEAPEEGGLNSLAIWKNKDDSLMRLHFAFYDAGGNAMADYSVSTGFNSMAGDEEFANAANEAVANAVQYIVNRYRLTY